MVDADKVNSLLITFCVVSTDCPSMNTLFGVFSVLNLSVLMFKFGVKPGFNALRPMLSDFASTSLKSELLVLTTPDKT